MCRRSSEAPQRGKRRYRKRVHDADYGQAHFGYRLLPAPYTSHTQQVSGTITTSVRHSRSSMHRRATGEAEIAGATKPEHPAAATRMAIVPAIHGPCPVVLNAAKPKVVPTVIIPLMTHTIVLRSTQGARSSRSAAVIAVNAMELN